MATDLGELLASESKALTTLGVAAIDSDKPKFTAGLANLLTSLVVQVPVLGALVEKTVLRAFTNSVNAQLDLELAKVQADEDRRAFATQIGDTLEPLIGQALIQLVRAQHNLADEQKRNMTAELGGLRDDLADFRADFAGQLGTATTGAATVQLERLTVTGASSIGIRVGVNTTKRVFARRIEVSNGGIGIDLT